MSILDKPLTPPPRRSRRRPLIILGIILILLIAVLVFTDVRADLAFMAHFVSAPNHFTYSGHSDYVSAVAWSPDGKLVAIGGAGDAVVLDATTGNITGSYGYHGGAYTPWPGLPTGYTLPSEEMIRQCRSGMSLRPQMCTVS